MFAFKFFLLLSCSMFVLFAAFCCLLQVYVGLERYLGQQGGGVRITLDRSKPLESSFTISAAAASSSSSSSSSQMGNIVTVPPAVVWPKRLWTGKQVGFRV